MEFLASLHPKIVHFPIALLFIYTFLESVGLFTNKEIFTKTAFILLILGVLGAFGAVLTGHQAEEAWTFWNAASKNLLEEHESLATITLWYFFFLLILRTLFVINVEIKNKFRQHALKMKIGFTVLAVAGCFFVYEAGEHGGKLVYKHAVGVSTKKQIQKSQLDNKD